MKRKRRSRCYDRHITADDLRYVTAAACRCYLTADCALTTVPRDYIDREEYLSEFVCHWLLHYGRLRRSIASGRISRGTKSAHSKARSLAIDDARSSVNRGRRFAEADRHYIDSTHPADRHKRRELDRIESEAESTAATQAQQGAKLQAARAAWIAACQSPAAIADAQ